MANAIDGQPTKYLNFDTRTDGKPSGFVVTPSIGATLVYGISMQSANDAPERDPKIVTLEGSNDDTVTDFASGNWELIVQLTVPAYTDRFQTQTFFFDNCNSYKHYRWTVLETQTINSCCMQIAEVELLGTTAPKDVTQPGDPMIASSSNSPGSEGVANAIDGQPTKYLNFDTRTDGKPSGFVVTPSIGATLVYGISMQSANDAPERDPKIVTLEGSNDDTVTDFASGNWELIAQITVPAYAARFQTQTFCFNNCRAYKHYRWTVLETQTINSCCMQIAEVELLGTSAPKDVTQPGDPIIASSSNSPGSEGVANAIDGQPTKYLNFDTRTDGKPSGFVVTPSIGATTVIGMTIQSANDAPERDPKIVTLEGSNDDTVTDFASGNWELIAQLEVPAFTARFQTQTLCFPNKKSFKHYRWTVLETATVNSCCMQVAEVELLGVTEGCPPGVAKFLLQPVDTPVLEGSQATFFVTINGPWPLQWNRNGVPIPGATSPTYTTPPVTPQNEGDVYTVVMCGDITSDPVRATIFKPASNKSIGVSFRGGGANGAPTLMNDDDIAGVWLQAHWNNAPNMEDGYFPFEEGDPPVTVDLKDSDGQVTDITFQWDTSGTWGSGTGNASSTQRMLNGLNGQNASDMPSTFIFGNVPDGEHSVLVYAVSPPLQFQVSSFKMIGATEKTYYMRTMNSDEYNAAPGFYSCFSTDVTNPEVGNFLRFDKVRPQDGYITLETQTLTSGFDRDTGVNAIQLVLNAPAVPPLALTLEPVPTMVQENSMATLTVGATGENLSYQWRKDGRPLPNGGSVSGANTDSLKICPFTPDDEGVYSVAVFSSGGSKVSRNAAVHITKCQINDALVGYWNFDETGGASAANSAPGGQAAAVTGAAAWQAGQIGNAFSFDGATYLFVPSFTLAKKAISASAWVNVPAGIWNDVAIIRNAQGEMTVSGGAARIVGQFEMGLDYDDISGLLRPMAAIGIGPNVARAIGPAAFPTDGWHHIAFTADGAQLRLYVDGVQVAVEDYLAEINPPDIPYISIGARLNLADPADPNSLGPDTSFPNFMWGLIDDVAIWTRALPAGTVSAIYQGGKQKKPVTDTVEECPPMVPCEVTEIQLSVSASGGNVTVTWNGGTLQTAPSVTGEWTDSPASSPLTEPAAQAAKFYRAVRK